MKKLISLLAVLTLLVSCMAGAFAEGAAKYTSKKTKDGWIKVEQEDGPELGYSPDSGVTLLEVDGHVFKDLNRNGELDVYEDWRQDADTRARDLVSQMTLEQVAGHLALTEAGGRGSVKSANLDDTQKDSLNKWLRYVQTLSPTSTNIRDTAEYHNAIQAYAEAMDLGIAVNFACDPQTTANADYPRGENAAASFSTEASIKEGQHTSKVFRAAGIHTMLGPQIDTASEPRWRRNGSTLGEDPQLLTDLAEANINAMQSTYDEEGNDLGWGKDSIVAMMKHFPGDGNGQSGREGHFETGAFNVYPNDNFEISLIPFIDGGLNLSGKTKQAAAVMFSYSIAWSDDESYGELVASAFSEYKVSILRENGWDGLITTDWGIDTNCAYGDSLKGLSGAELIKTAFEAGIDQIGGAASIDVTQEGAKLFAEDYGEDQLRGSAVRAVRNTMLLGVYENPYVDVSAAVKAWNGKDVAEEAYAMQHNGIVMVKNDGAIKDTTANTEKPTVYVPLVYYTSEFNGGLGNTGSATVEFPFDKDYLSKYCNIVTDTVAETLTGPANRNGDPTPALEDITRASKEELANCDYALIFAVTPCNLGNIMNFNPGHDGQNYIPLSLQYRPYTADSDAVRTESIAGFKVETTVETVYGPQTTFEKENQSYFGRSALIGNENHLDMILETAANVPETCKVILVMVQKEKSPAAVIPAEFEPAVDAILFGWHDYKTNAIVDIALGKVEPSGLLPISMPASMEAVEAQAEDTPRDVECYVDSMGNTYSFAFGMNWSGVIDDERTAKYNVEPLTHVQMEGFELP